MACHCFSQISIAFIIVKDFLCFSLIKPCIIKVINALIQKQLMTNSIITHLFVHPHFQQYVAMPWRQGQAMGKWRWGPSQGRRSGNPEDPRATTPEVCCYRIGRPGSSDWFNLSLDYVLCIIVFHFHVGSSVLATLDHTRPHTQKNKKDGSQASGACSCCLGVCITCS
jgi:hypothetical protein